MPEVERNDFVADRADRKDGHVNLAPLLQDLHDRPILAHDRCRLRGLKNDRQGQIARLSVESIAKCTHHLKIVRRTRGERCPTLELDNSHALAW